LTFRIKTVTELKWTKIRDVPDGKFYYPAGTG